jgi:hypothetical protein
MIIWKEVKMASKDEIIKKLTVTRTRVIKMFKQLGFKTADNWTNKELERKLKNIPDLMPGVRREEFKMPKLFGKICRSELVVVKPDDSNVKESSKVAKKKKKSKKEAVAEAEPAEKKAKKKGKKKGEKKAEKKAEKKSSKKAEKKKSKLELVVEAILAAKKKASVSGIAQKVDDAIVKSGGSANLKATLSTTKTCINILTIANAIDSSKFTE